MEYLVWIGALITLGGVGILGWCVVEGLKARRAGLDDEALKKRLQRIVAVNMGGLFVSAIGLMCVVVGVILS